MPHRLPLLSSLLIVPLTSAATDVNLQPLVVSGSRSEAADFDLPFSVDSLDRRQISDGQPGINVSEVLQRVPGLVVQNRQNYAQDLQISSRGFGARSTFGVRGIKLIADGIPASTPDGQGQAATFDLDTAERIEVLRGPMATMYGSNAGGVIQLFSRDGEGPPQISAGTAYDSDGLNKQRLSAEGGNRQAGFIIDSSRLDTDGYRDHSATRREQNFAKLNLNPDDDNRLALIYNDLNQQSDDPLGLSWDAYQADPRSVAPAALQFDTRKSIDHRQLGLNYERDLGDASGGARIQGTLYAGTRRVVQYQSIPRTVQLASIRQAGGVIDFDREFHGGSLRWLQPVEAVPGEFEWVLGLDYDRSEDDRQGYENFVGDQLGVKGNLRRDEIDTITSLDPYLQANWSLGDWTLQAGVRHNRVEAEVSDRFLANGDDSGSRTYQQNTPAIGLMYAFTADLHGYISAGKGFETPTTTELAYSPGGGGFNLDLQPSTSRQYEIGLKALFGENTRLNAALFEIHTDDELVVASSFGGRTTYQNAARTLRRGFELALDTQLNERWRGYLAYTRLDARYDDDFLSNGQPVDKGKHLPGVPGTTLYGELLWQPREGLNSAVEGVYRSQVYVDDSNRAKPAPSYAVFNWRTRLEQRLDHWTFGQTLRLDNLLDRQYIGSVIVADGNGRYYEPAPSRNWYAGLDAAYRF
ncbi:TonB-dependent receptor [Pseudomonas sp. LS44]|uniref:TonB-dependent receptor family protein n=1 Tax=Pseudomonas sp. LS44 TaxID=1357074 RepID=UPI00215B2052|nr:TonB-dependent receptor [Pseudomonas sp. LS44]UVE19460.1 TonB-dependent receptor [Pseudomonas sp. LS44]